MQRIASTFQRANIPLTKSSVGGPLNPSPPGKPVAQWYPRRWVKTFALDLSVSRSNVAIEIAGDAFCFVESFKAGVPSPNDRVDIYFDDPAVNDLMRFRPFSTVVEVPGGFRKLIVSNAAQAGSTDAFFAVFISAKEEAQ